MKKYLVAAGMCSLLIITEQSLASTYTITCPPPQTQGALWTLPSFRQHDLVGRRGFWDYTNSATGGKPALPVPSDWVKVSLTFTKGTRLQYTILCGNTSDSWEGYQSRGLPTSDCSTIILGTGDSQQTLQPSLLAPNTTVTCFGGSTDCPITCQSPT